MKTKKPNIQDKIKAFRLRKERIKKLQEELDSEIETHHTLTKAAFGICEGEVIQLETTVKLIQKVIEG